jgi:hypothetical protein
MLTRREMLWTATAVTSAAAALAAKDAAAEPN